MENYINTLPIKQVLIFLAIGGLLHIVFYTLTTYIIPVIKKKQVSYQLYWNRIQIVSWTIYLLLFFSSLFIANKYLTIAITLIVVAIGWTFWTNFFAGVMIKFTNQYKANDSVSTDIVSGKIKALKMTYTEIVNSKGELLVIPNNQLKKAVLKHHSKKNTLKTHTYHCTTNSLTYKNVHNYALNCPYFTGNQSIKVVKDDNKFVIKAMLLDERFHEDAIKYFESLK